MNSWFAVIEMTDTEGQVVRTVIDLPETVDCTAKALSALRPILDSGKVPGPRGIGDIDLPSDDNPAKVYIASVRDAGKAWLVQSPSVKLDFTGGK